MPNLGSSDTSSPPPRALLDRLQAATTTVERALVALAHVDPAAAAAWLLEEPPSVPTALGTGASLEHLIRVICTTGVAKQDARVTARLADLLRAYGDLVMPDALAGVINALPVEQRDKSLSRLVTYQLRRAPAHAELLRLASDMAARGGDHAEAHRLLTRLARADNSQGTVYSAWRARARLGSPGGPVVRAALVSSYVVDPLVPYLDLECRDLGLTPALYVAPLNSWVRDFIAEDSGLRHFHPEIVFLAVSLDDLVPDLVTAPAPERLREAGAMAVEQVLDIARAFRSWSDAVLVVHGFHSAYPDPAGILAGSRGASRTRWIADLNGRLGDALREMPRCFLLEVSEILLRRPEGGFENPKMRHLAGMRLGDRVLGEIARAYAGYVAPLKGLTRKCVVLDLDNTLWGGIVGEDGAHEIQLGDTAPGSEYRELQHYLLYLKNRGLLLAINSKNNAEEALAVIRSHDGMILREDAFSAVRINWRPKPENLVSIAEELGIGVDAMVFLDDNPDERELMRQALPDVLTPELPADPALRRPLLQALPQLQTLAVTEEDQSRATQYASRRERERLRLSVESLEGFLHSLELAVTIASATEASLPRVHQLVQRTNQFNLTSRRYDPAQLARMLGDRDWRIYVARVQDRFGDHGLVATALVRIGRDAWVIDSFLMSCRVIGYGVETALLAAVSEEARAAGAQALQGECVETKKNAPARDLYARHGFALQEGTNGVTLWGYPLTGGSVPPPAWVRMTVGDGA